MKLNDRRKEALIQLEGQMRLGTKPTSLSAAEAKLKGFKNIDGKYREPMSPSDRYKKQQQISVLKERIK